jgi:hypothetical protein
MSESDEWKETVMALKAYRGSQVYSPTAGAVTVRRVRRPMHLGGRTWSVDPRERGTCGSLPGGR